VISKYVIDDEKSARGPITQKVIGQSGPPGMDYHGPF